MSAASTVLEVGEVGDPQHHPLVSAFHPLCALRRWNGGQPGTYVFRFMSTVGRGRGPRYSGFPLTAMPARY